MTKINLFSLTKF